jgi:hypothetical protein
MKQFDALVRVVHMETWSVEAKDEAAARKKFSKLTEDVQDDETGGEVVDWEVYSLKEVDPETGQPVSQHQQREDQS